MIYGTPIIATSGGWPGASEGRRAGYEGWAVRGNAGTMPRLRIAEVSPPWLAVPPKGYGGIERVVAMLCDGLVERGHDVTLFATGDSTTRAKLDFVLEHAPGPTMINEIWHDTVHTLHAFRDPSAFDVFHLHSPWSSLAAGVQLERPLVHTLHGPFTPQMRRLYSQIGDRAWFVAISQDQRSHMPELNYAGVVYNGIDVAAYRFREDKDDFVLFLGRATPDKGVLRAVLAAKEAGARLVLAVKVTAQEEICHWNQDVLPVLPPDATVLGEISIDEKLDLLSRARAVLFPIDWEEPFGLVMTEAMACGTPVIATPRGSVQEVVADRKTGFIVSVDAYPSEAAAALKRIREIDPHACRARVKEMFSKEAMIGGYEEVFAGVVAKT